jgi:glucose-6-phosphate 1-dehydrogenase
LVPSLYSQYAKGRLSKGFRVIGTSRSDLSDADFRERMRDGVREFASRAYDEATWKEFAKLLFYVAGDAAQEDGMGRLKQVLDNCDADTENRLYYLSVAPQLYGPIVAQLGALNMADQTTGWRRLVVEKPFGTDLKTATELTTNIHKVFSEQQVYRIDHYLGKETAQNLLFFRFANAIFEPIWNRNVIDSVQITVAENVDVGHRAGYYDHAGVLRDMFQNHLLQLLTLVAMEPPNSFEADALRNEKVKILRAVRPVMLYDTVRGQYEGYCALPDVESNSQTPTYAALKLYVDNWRWQGVPFYLRSGKSLAHKQSEIVIEFKRPPHLLFANGNTDQMTPNLLSMRIQPDEGIHLTIQAKQPDSVKAMLPVDLTFHYDDTFNGISIPDAYERLLLDALNGDAALFTRADEIAAAWSIIDPILYGWAHIPEAPLLQTYKPGSWGPDSADVMLARSGRQWWVGDLES